MQTTTVPTLAEYPLPDSLDVHRVFPLDLHVFGLSCGGGTYLWEPRKARCRYLSDLPDPVFMQREGDRHLLINRQGLVIRIP
ncbi:MAG: hypothetical protein U5N26_02375 [Candidatus Marinimicrobia bacterium]|nr:hypothetical protein [Candidatus Neomarinimicrobiota bacterium]